MAIFLLGFGSVLPVSAKTLTVALIRIAFQVDDSPATTGDGHFVLEDTMDLDCPVWSLDPAPHDKSYFLDHLEAADNYWKRVSEGIVRIDLLNSDIYPVAENAAYELPHDMLYYHPYLDDFDETEKLFELSRDALSLADPDIDFSQYSTVILVHAGMGGDFAFALDPTPGNIPSAYLGLTDFNEYGGLETEEKVLEDLIIIPESQNFLQFEETRTLFTNTSDPCFYQVGLNGTLALMLGFHLGLPPLYNTESGRSLVGGFALMDQGSNNFHGVAPAYPDPFSRIEAGWITPIVKTIGDTVAISVSDPPIRISISETEYYLIENRQRNLYEPSDMTLWIDDSGFDTVSVNLSLNGVVLQVDEQNAGLPGNGLYIWHIDELARQVDENPNGGNVQFIDFVEADGAQDMGHTTQLLFADYLETGWWFDPWFAGNEGWFHLNRKQEIVGDSLLQFTSSTFPSTKANSGLPSHLSIKNISKNGTIMSFTIGSDRIVDQDAIGDLIGWGNSGNSIWAFTSDSSQIVEAVFEQGSMTIKQTSSMTPEMIYEDSIDSLLTYRYPWIVTHIMNPEGNGAGTRFRNIETDSKHDFWTIVNPYEISVHGSRVSFFSDSDSGTVLVKWDSQTGVSTTEPVISPVVKFETISGIQVISGDSDHQPIPVAVTHQNDFYTSPLLPDGLDVLSWSSSESALELWHLPEGTKEYVFVDQPDRVIPIDVDEDGIYEMALFYSNSVKIINQAGILWNGSPFIVDSYVGNPLILTAVDSEPALFLRHRDHYSLSALNGQILEKGVLPIVENPTVNSLGIQNGITLIHTGNNLLYFENENLNRDRNYWSGPFGRQQGDRVVVLSGEPGTGQSKLQKGSVYNYPNPVKGNRTTIRAWVGEADKWTIEIFSMNGAQISYVEQQVSQPNAYNEWVWESTSVSNGVYLAQVVVGKQAEIIKIAIIR